MRFLTVFIRRPVLATMLTALLVVLGLFSYRSLGVDLMPKVEFPFVTVITTLRGASPEEIESQITKPIEEAVNTVAGIDELNSASFEGVSRVSISFKLEVPIAEAVQDVRDRVAAAVRNLPEDADPPVVTKRDVDSFPVISLTVSGSRDMKEISEIARLQVKEALENVSGVGAVTMVGAWTRAINIVLDAERLAAYRLPVAEVRAALLAQNVEIPGGRIDEGMRERVVRTLARVERLEDFGRLVVATRGGRQVLLGDIARVQDSVEEPRSLARVWRTGQPEGRPAVTIEVVKQSGTNTIEVIDGVKQRLAGIRTLLPAGAEIDIVSDQSVFIRRSIHELNLHLVLGGLLASLAVLLFMRSLRSTLIAAVAIPTSLIATFTAMRALDFTLNNMSLLGLTLSVGIVIDDAIVVLENIFRHMEEQGKSAFEASIDGLQEIGLAVLATTTSLIVIFLPVAFMEGMVGRFFYEFGITVAVAIGISLIVSLTLTPMLSSRFLKAGGGSKESGWWRAVDSGYGLLLRWSLRHRLATVAIALLLVASSVPLARTLGMDFMPSDDRSEFQLSVIAPAGSTLSSVDRLLADIERRVRQVRGVRLLLTQIGDPAAGSEDVTLAKVYVGIEDLADRDYSQWDVMREVRSILASYPGLRASVNEFGGFSGSRGGQQFSYNLTGPSLEQLTLYSDRLAAELSATPGFVDVDTSLSTRQPELRLEIDRARAADLGITAGTIASSVRTLISGERAGTFREGVEQYDVWLRLEPEDRDSPEAVGRIPIASARGELVPLSQLVGFGPGLSPSQIDRFNRQRQVQISANLSGLDLGRANQKVAELTAGLSMPPDYRGVTQGRSKRMGEALSNMLLAFLLALIFMYIVLAAQFEHFVHPVTILLALPLTLPFALLSLLMLGETMNLYSILGIFMLFGIVKKNGILQIDYTNTLREGGMPLTEAIIEANHARLRPILMTTVTLVAGMVPIALGEGPGAAARASMAKVIIGGQALSLLITLLIVPVCYSLFAGSGQRRS